MISSCLAAENSGQTINLYLCRLVPAILILKKMVNKVAYGTGKTKYTFLVKQ